MTSVGIHRIEGASPLVVLLSAKGTGMDYWQDVLDKLDTRPMVLAYDRPGVMESPPRPAPNPPLPYSAFANELAELLKQQQNHRPVVLVGHSFGDLIALAFARRWPEQVAGLVHLDGSLPHMDLGGAGSEPLVDGEGPDATEIDPDAEADEIAGMAVPIVPTIAVSRTPGWWWPSGTAPPSEDARWHDWHRHLVSGLGAVRFVAKDAGHNLPALVPALCGYATDQVVNAVRARRHTVTVDSGAVWDAGGRIGG